MRNLSYIIFLIIVLLTSCSDGDHEESTPCSYDIVCLKEQSDERGSVFSLYRPDGSKEIIYTDPRAVVDLSKISVGDRLMLAYIPHGIPYESGTITTRGYSTIYNSELMVSPKGTENSLEDWRRDGVFLYSIWRSGNYLNVRARLTYSEESREFLLVVDAADVEARNPVPTVRLVHRMSKPVENFERQLYSSFDISALWGQPWIRGIKVELANTNLDTDTFIFIKE